MFTLKFSTENAAFHEPTDPLQPTNECARILIDIAESLRIGITQDVIMDLNGNKIGQWSYEVNNDEEIT